MPVMAEPASVTLHCEDFVAFARFPRDFCPFLSMERIKVREILFRISALLSIPRRSTLLLHLFLAQRQQKRKIKMK